MRKLIILILIISCFQSYSQSLRYKHKYQEKLESNSKLIESGFNYTVEKLNDTTYIFKKYYPETKVITCRAVYNSRELNNLHGDYIFRYDNGEEVNKGSYVNNLKEGKWLENNFEIGEYKNGKKHGEWITTDSKDRITIKSMYDEGELIGNKVFLDSVGQIKYIEEYENGEMIATTRDTIINEGDAMPRFLGCEKLDGTDLEKKKCADRKMLEYIYKKIKYPKKAKLQGIQGTALVRFTVEKDGTISNTEVLIGLTKEIGQECRSIIKNMPRWRPGIVNKKPIKVQFNLPIQFKLD